MRNQKWFTLIELLVVVMIIGILAAVGLPKYMRTVEKSKVAEAMTFVSEASSSEMRYFAQNGSFADSTNLDVEMPPNLKHYGPTWANGNTNIAITLSRLHNNPAGAGYTVVGTIDSTGLFSWTGTISTVAWLKPW